MDSSELIQVGTPEQLIFSPANDLVAEIVDSKRKYRHIDALKVKDIMQPLDKRYIFDVDMPPASALDLMTREGVEFAFVFGEKGKAGRVYLKDVLSVISSGKALKEAVTPLPLFSPETPLLQALVQLKEKEELLGFVFENNEPSGILFSEKVLRDLI